MAELHGYEPDPPEDEQKFEQSDYPFGGVISPDPDDPDDGYPREQD
jgi:hypothetical protein